MPRPCSALYCQGGEECKQWCSPVPSTQERVQQFPQCLEFPSPLVQLPFNTLIFFLCPKVGESAYGPLRDIPTAGHKVPGGVLFSTMSLTVLPFSPVEGVHSALSSSLGEIAVCTVGESVCLWEEKSSGSSYAAILDHLQNIFFLKKYALNAIYFPK